MLTRNFGYDYCMNMANFSQRIDLLSHIGLLGGRSGRNQSILLIVGSVLAWFYLDVVVLIASGGSHVNKGLYVAYKLIIEEQYINSLQWGWLNIDKQSTIWDSYAYLSELLT